MIKYIKWLCLIIAIIGICILSYIFIKNSSVFEEKEDTFKIDDIYNIAWYKTKIETYENEQLTNKVTLLDPEYITFTETNIQYTDPITNQINSYKYKYKDKILTIYDAKRYLLEGSYNISLENEQLKLTQEENNRLKVYYFTKAAG